MKISVTSREMVKPSTTTPSALHHHQLSFIDQMNGQIFSPMIYFYPSTSHVGNTNSDKPDKLKKSLSKTLTKFYPLAGRLNECRQYVDCTDEGVEVIEAKVDCQMSQILAHQINIAVFNQLLPHYMLQDAGNIPMLVQLNFFECGGMAIAMRFNHKFMDALSITKFVNYWATINSGCGDDHMVTPRLDLARLFPPRNIPSRTFEKQASNILAKRFVFSKDDISILRERYATRFLHPTRVAAVSAFILGRIASVIFQMTNQRRNYEVAQLVNMCNRMNPPVPEPYFGNLYAHATVTIDMEKGSTEEAHNLLTKMTDAVKRIDGDYVENYLEEIYLRKHWGGDEQIIFSSLINFPIYEADFGWGKPIWFTSGKDPMDTKVTFHPTRSGEGIEAIIKLKDDDMAKLESDDEFLAFTSPYFNAKFSSQL